MPLFLCVCAHLGACAVSLAECVMGILVVCVCVSICLPACAHTFAQDTADTGREEASATLEVKSDGQGLGRRVLALGPVPPFTVTPSPTPLLLRVRDCLRHPTSTSLLTRPLYVLFSFAEMPLCSFAPGRCLFIFHGGFRDSETPSTGWTFLSAVSPAPQLP